MSNENSGPEKNVESGSADQEGHSISPAGTRIVFWLLFLYALGFALMVIEDILSHIFI